MKKTSLLLVVAFCLVFIGCGRIHGPVDEVKAFADEKEEVLSQMGEKIEANPSEAGIDEARKVFEGKKDSLKAKRQAIKAAPQGFNKDWQSLLDKTESRHDDMLRGMGTKLSIACYSEQCQKKWKALEKDFEESARFYQRYVP